MVGCMWTNKERLSEKIISCLWIKQTFKINCCGFVGLSSDKVCQHSNIAQCAEKKRVVNFAVVTSLKKDLEQQQTGRMWMVGTHWVFTLNAAVS